MMAILGDIAVVVVLLRFLLLLKKNMKFYFDSSTREVLLKGSLSTLDLRVRTNYLNKEVNCAVLGLPLQKGFLVSTLPT
jgi:hypothetical protein